MSVCTPLEEAERRNYKKRKRSGLHWSRRLPCRGRKLSSLNRLMAKAADFRTGMDLPEIIMHPIVMIITIIIVAVDITIGNILWIIVANIIISPAELTSFRLNYS